MISLKDITKTYGSGSSAFRALSNVSLEIKKGELAAIMGPSGSGKSTLLHLVGLLDTPDKGIYTLDGTEIKGLSERSLAVLRREKIGFIFQQFHLLPRLNVLENVALPLVYSGKKDQRHKASEILKKVGLSSKEKNLPSQLSGGERQRVAIARALMNEPEIILADEPTGNLDSKSQEEIMKILLKLNEEGKTVVIITHEEEVASYARRIIKIRDGRIYSDRKKHGAKKAAANTGAGKESASKRMMEAGDFIRQAVASIMGNKMRSALSMLGITIGVAAVIAMLALGEGASSSIKKSLSSLGSNLLMVMPGSVRHGPVQIQAGAVTRLTAADAELIKKIPLISDSYGNVNGRAQLVYGGKNWNTLVQGTGAAYVNVRAQQPAYGRFFSEGEERSRAMVAVLGTTAASELFGSQNPLGKQIKINRKNFTVIGVMAQQGGMGFRDNDDVVFIPLTTAMYRLLGKQYVDSIDVKVADFNKMDAAQGALENVLRKRYNVRQGEAAGFSVMNMTEIQKTMTQTTQALSLFLGFVGAISLIVGGIGIMNIMLVSVTERTREIGLRKAIGAASKDILSQFVIESVMLTLIGGILGILAGASIALILSTIAKWSAIITPFSVILSVIFSAAVGLAFGIMPARKAAKLDPIEALRYE